MAWRLSTTRAKRNTLQVKDLKAAILASSRWDFLIDTVDLFDDEQQQSAEMSRQQRIAETKPVSAALQAQPRMTQARSFDSPAMTHTGTSGGFRGGGAVGGASSDGTSEFPLRRPSFAEQQHPGMISYSSQLCEVLEARREKERHEQELFDDLRRATYATQRGEQCLHENIVDASRELYQHRNPSLAYHPSLAHRVGAFPSLETSSQPIGIPPHMRLPQGRPHYSACDDQQLFSQSSSSALSSTSTSAEGMDSPPNMPPPQLPPLLPPQLPPQLTLQPLLSAHHHVHIREQERLALLGTQLADSLVHGGDI
jgi:hypothetical protein